MATRAHAPLGGRLVTAPFFMLLLLVFAAVIVLTQRFVFGLGAVTHLSDGYPWGIWIAIDLIIGTAFGCGGLVIALLVYILNQGGYHPLMRAALMTSLFGYTLGAIAVMIDLGRWWQGHNILLPWLWNPTSVLLETALCIFLYIIVLAIEFSPTVLERFGLREINARLKRVLFVFAALGVLLPMMHQSSMGTVIIILGYKISPLWQSQLLTLNFLITAFTMGFAVVAFESILASATLRRPFDTRILSGLTGIMAAVMAIFIGVRSIDLLRLGAWPLAFTGDAASICFWVEFLAGIAAVLLLLPKANRSHPRYIFLGAAAMLVNGFMYRLNAYLIGYDPGQGWHYFPSVGELVVTFGIFAIEILLYLAFIKYLPVLHVAHETPSATAIETK
jgi:Ni/Fe-hydrogenase subunit HybB-like protein